MNHFFKHIAHLTRPVGSDIAEQKQRTKILSVWEGSLWSIMWGLGESYIAPFALFLGAGNLTMAFIGTGPVLITAAAQLAGAVLLDRIGRRKPVILAGMTVQAAALIPLFSLPLLIPSYCMIILIACVAVYFFFSGLSAPPWMSLMGDIVETKERGRYFSNRSRIAMYFMTSSLMLAGIITNGWENIGFTAVGFGFAFGIASLARFTSLFFMRRHYDAPLGKQQFEDSFSLWDFLRGYRKSNFTKFTIAVALMNGTANIAGPFFSVYMLRDLHWSYLAYTFNMLVFLSSQTLFVRWWGAIGDRHGNRSVLMATGCLLPILPVLWIFSDTYLVLLCVQLLSGATWSGFNLAASNFIYDSVPQTRRGPRHELLQPAQRMLFRDRRHADRCVDRRTRPDRNQSGIGPHLPAFLSAGRLCGIRIGARHRRSHHAAAVQRSSRYRTHHHRAPALATQHRPAALRPSRRIYAPPAHPHSARKQRITSVYSSTG